MIVDHWIGKVEGFAFLAGSQDSGPCSGGLRPIVVLLGKAPSQWRPDRLCGASPADEEDAVAASEKNLAKVWWVSLAESDKLMDWVIYEPVRQHLCRALSRS